MIRRVIGVIAGLLLLVALSGCARADRPQGGQVQAPEAIGEGLATTVSEAQMNAALAKALAAAADTPVQSLSVDLRPGVIATSTSVLVEGRTIATEVDLAPVVESCSLSFSVVAEPAQPSGIPAQIWDSVVDRLVKAIESATITPRTACIKSVSVSDGRMSVAVGRK